MRFITLILFSVFLTAAAAQTHDLTFAVVTDLHVGQNGAGEAAISTVNDINQNPLVESFYLSQCFNTVHAFHVIVHKHKGGLLSDL